MAQLLAFNESKTLKKDLLAEARRHQKADDFIQGTYGKGSGKSFKGCAVGCTIQSYNARRGKAESTSDHSVYERDLGIPRILARLEDRIFEGLSVEDSKKFPVEFLEAIEPGVDLSMVWYKFVVWMLNDKTDGVIKFAKTDRTKESIKTVVKLYKRHIKGETIAVGDWRAAAYAAYAAYAAAYAADAADAAADAAYAAADAADAAYAAYADAAADAADAAYAAADAAYAAYAAAYAAYAADADADADAADAYAAAARRGHYKKMADKLLELLREAK